ncbi:hypothetical protein [Streptomyces wuyuanensis]|uniref:Uncharacterized protein n=1 Tax=Streptomyces wuyuanensis TaxID=1196353 RepID=A0A1H0A5E9_9ACTN|nr:hypothetical protein [Streptomyces wuyuanensis]SDN28213.1 hypothetical protein SAMN05444921_12371 [Streptomyces wuyuanensis]
MPEGGPAVAVEDFEPVASLLQAVAAARQQGDGGGGDPQAAGGEEVVLGEQPVQEAARRIGGPWRRVVVHGSDVVALGDAQYRGADLRGAREHR